MGKNICAKICSVNRNLSLSIVCDIIIDNSKRKTPYIKKDLS